MKRTDVNSKQGMLILSRRNEESIVIDERIVVTVLGIKGNQVRLGVNAPKNVSIMRSELLAHDQRKK